MAANDAPQLPIPMASPSLPIWGRIVKSLATNIDHMNPAADPNFAAGPPPTTGPAPKAPLLNGHAAAMANNQPGTLLKMTGREFQDLLDEHTAGITVPQEIAHVYFIQSAGDTLVVRLPARQALIDREKQIQSSGKYQPANAVAAWYAALAAGAPPAPAAAPGAAASPIAPLTIHDALVGDYAITHCM